MSDSHNRLYLVAGTVCVKRRNVSPDQVFGRVSVQDVKIAVTAKDRRTATDTVLGHLRSKYGDRMGATNLSTSRMEAVKAV